MISPTTAILVFTNSGTKELEYKPLPKGEELFDALTQHTLHKAGRTGLPVFHITEREQVGTTFGERFTNAIATVFELGFEHIITIGNDTPQLRTQHLKKAAKQLALGKTVIGPSTDGGFYLMGLQRANFDTSVLKSLPWQRYSLFHKISLWFQGASSEIIKLPVLQDLDNEKDLKSTLHFSRSLTSVIRELIHLILGYTLNPGISPNIDFDQFLSKSLYNKGSPKAVLA